MKQPEPPNVAIRTDGKKIWYSLLNIDELMKLRKFLDDLIKWKAAGNPVYIGSMTFTVTVDAEPTNVSEKTK